ncbi:MAG: hypothetical protein U0822_08000 [Anaerolineae bacterium]
MLAQELTAETRLAEALGLLEEVSLLLMRVNGSHPDLIDLQLRVHNFVQVTDGPPIGEVVQRGQDLREAVGRFGFNIADPIVATAWADLITALDVIFPQEVPYLSAA